MRTQAVSVRTESQAIPTIDEIKAWPATVDLVTAARPLGIGRTKAHEMARRGTFPVRLLRLGNRYRVSTAVLLAFLGVDVQQQADNGEQVA